MANKSINFNLEYFKPGSLYSGGSDYRRFTTLDYNLKSYVGIIGVGIINGWEIKTNKDESFESLGDLEVIISYGKGLINGYSAESPYYVKRRTSLAIPEREIEIIRFDSEPEPYMTAQERLDYMAVIQAYDPTFVAPAPCENTYVKCVLYDDPNEFRTAKMVLDDNTDSYIYAQFPSNWEPYPQLTDDAWEALNVSSINEPVSSDYATYDAYLTALAAYEDALEAYYAYNWQFYIENHFTEVVFKSYATKQNDPNKVLLGMVTTRDGKIETIDTTGVSSLASLEASIRKKAKTYITKHIHGGSDPYDPPKINLETDIRQCILNTYYSNTGASLFDIAEKYYTSIEEGHKHSYVIDENGDGQTIEHVGDGVKHFHIISNYIISQPLTSYATVTSHTHTVPNADNYIDGWTSENDYNVYANGKVIGGKVGNTTSSNIELDLDNKQIKIFGGVGIQYKEYYCSFKAYEQDYSFTKSAFSTYSFMLFLIADYHSKFAANIQSNPDNSPITASIVLNPSISTDLIRQSQVADKSLLKSGDNFVFTTPVAQNITVTSLKVSPIISEYDVTIEVLGNSEVTGILKDENVVYIHADKFISGEFDIARIPFVSHIGRLGEEFSPYKLPMSSRNAYKYQVLPYIADVKDGHYHTVFVNSSGNGYTVDTMLDDEAVLYADGKDGKEYMIAHIHTIENFELKDASSTGYSAWRTTFSETLNETDYNHSHNLQRVNIGDGKSIYSIAEDKDGNMWVGTSNGLIIKPYLNAYQFTINGNIVTQIGNDLWSILQSASIVYQNKYGKPINVTDDYEEQVDDIEEELTSHGASQTLIIKSEGTSASDIILITKLEYITLNDLYVTSLKQGYELDSDDIILGIKLFNIETGEEVSLDDENLVDYLYQKLIKLYYQTQKNISFSPYWGIFFAKRKTSDVETICAESASSGNTVETDDVHILSSDVFAFNYLVTSDLTKEWSAIKLPLGSEVLKKSIKDVYGNIWIITNNSIIVSRQHMVNQKAEIVDNPATSQIIYDIVEDGDGDILCTTNNGIYRTQDQGKTWSLEKASSIGFTKICRDFKNDITDGSIGHRHLLNINKYGDGLTSLPTLGTPHIHVVSDWDIQDASGHGHTIETILYAMENDGSLYRSYHGGTWEKLTNSNFDERGALFAFNGYVFLSTSEGLQRFNGNDWQLVSTNVPLSFGMSFDLQTLFVTYYNKYESSDDGLVFETEYDFSGEAQAFVDDGDRKYFGYAVSNRNSCIYFDTVTVPENQLALADFGKWSSERGGWTTSNIDIYFNEQLCYSNKKNIDLRGTTVPYFKIDSDNGIIDFSATAKITEDADVYSQSVQVDSTSDFYVGDKILIYNAGTLPPQPKPLKTVEVAASEAGTDEEKSIEEIENEYTEKINEMKSFNDSVKLSSSSIKNYYGQYKVCEISTIGDKVITLTQPLDVKFEKGCMLCRLNSFGIETLISANIFESGLYDSGTSTHDELENKLTDIITGAPYKLGNVYFSNILQLTQAMRYVYPDINQYFRNAEFYDMHYSDTVGGILPYIGDYIDTYNSYIHTKASYDSGFSPKKATKINCIYLGSGEFDGMIFVGTDIGLMWSYNSASKEENWVYASGLNYAVYSIRTHLNDNIMVGTENGVYISENLSEWERLTDGVITFPCYDLKLRWDDEEAVYIYDADVTFQNYTGEDDIVRGLMLVSSDVSGIKPNNIIRVTDSDDDFVGAYVVDAVEAGKIYLQSKFDTIPSAGIYDITMAAWWGQFSNETNVNSDLTNPIIAAGYNGLSVAIYPDNMIWQSASIEDFESQYAAKNVTPITTGSVLASATTISENEKSVIIKSNDSGTSWKPIKTFESYLADILSYEPTLDGHTKLIVTYSTDANVPNGVQRLQSAFIVGSENQYKVLWNENDGTDNIIYIYGTEIIDNLSGLVSPKIRVSTVKNINDIEEYNSSIFVGTDAGIWSDNGTLYSTNSINGVITGNGISGSIKSFDINGTIKSVSVNENGNVVIYVGGLDSTLYKDQMINGSIYIRNVSPVKKYTIKSHSSTRAESEASIELEATYTVIWQNYIGRNITISKQNTKVYITFNQVVASNELLNGKLYIVTSAQEQKAVSYTIINNGSDYVTLSDEIDFSKTLVKEGNSILAENKDGEISIYVRFNMDIEDMSLIGKNIILLQSPYSRYIDGDITIKSNEVNKIVLNKVSLSNNDSPSNSSATIESVGNYMPFLFGINETFAINGGVISPVKSFQFRKTSEEQGHYHNLNLVAQKLLANITSISNNANTKYADIVISNVSGFDNAILAVDPYLLDEEQIIFTNSNNPYVFFKKKVKSIVGSTLTVEIGNVNEWNMTSYDENLISPQWSLSIDATTYGFTSGTFYNDFEVLGEKLTQNVSSGDSIIYIESTAGFAAGNKIRIVGVSNKSEENVVESVLDATRLELRFGLSKSYVVADGAYVKLLSNSFANTHTHKITKNRVELVAVTSYHDAGYDLKHSHETEPYIRTINSMAANGSGIAVVGSSSKVYLSANGTYWHEVVDLNNCLENGRDISSIHKIIFENDNGLVAGADDMHLYFQNYSPSAIEDFESPVLGS